MEVTEVRADDAVGVGQAGDRNDTDVCTGVDELTISKARKVNLVVQNCQTACGTSLLEGLNQGTVVVPTAEDNEVLLDQDGLWNLVVDSVKDADDIRRSDTNGGRNRTRVTADGRTRSSDQQLVNA